LELLEAEEGAGDLAVEGDLVAQEKFVDANALRGGAQSEDCTERTRFFGGIARGDVMVECDLLHGPDSILPPARCGDGVYQHDLGGSLRLVFFEEGFQKFQETAGELGLQNNGFREQTMTGRVAGGVAFALRGDGAF
jgi:hypothetical protein